MLVYQRVFCGWGRWARVRFPRERGLLERQHSWLLSDASDQRLLESCPNISYMCAKASTMQHLGLKRTILKNFEHVCRDWLLDPYIQIIPNLKAYTKMPGWSAFFATLSQEMFLPYLPYWSNCRGFGRTVPWGLQQQDATPDLSDLSDWGMERSDGGFILSKVCAEQVGWTLDSMSCFLFLSLLFVCCKCYKTADSCKPR